MKRLRWSLLGGVAVLALGGLGCDASRSEAEAAADAWTAQHADGWKLDVSSVNPEQGFLAGPSYETCANNAFWLQARTGKVELNLFFPCPVPGVVDLDWLRENLLDYVVSSLWVPIDAESWTFQAYPAARGLPSEVTFESWQNGQLSLRVVAPLGSISGESGAAACVAERMGADGGLADCYVSMDYEGPLELSLSVPLDPRTFALGVPSRP